MTTATGPHHLDDGALIRLLDRQPLPDDPQAQRGPGPALAGHEAAHLSACAECSARYRALERRSQALHGLLARARAAEPTPPADLLDRARETARRRAPAPRRWTDRPLLRAAAVAAVLCAGALTAQPVREWLGAAARQLVGALAPGAPAPTPGLAPPPPPASPASAAGADGSVEVTIVPSGDRLVLRFDAAEPGAVALIRFRDRTDASGQVLGDGPAPGLVALPDGFRVRNAGASGTRYGFTAPAGNVVEVRVGDRVIATLRGGAGAEREVTLGP